MMREEVGMLYVQVYIHEWIELPLSKIEHRNHTFWEVMIVLKDYRRSVKPPRKH